MSFIRFRTISTVVLAMLLAVLFWAPQRALTKSAAVWNVQIEEAADALRGGRNEEAKAACSALLLSFRERKDTLERFLHHDAVDAALSSVWEAKVLADAEDAPGALAALAAAQGGIEHLLCIEQFHWNALL